MILSDLPRGAKLRVRVDGDAADAELRPAIFHRLDGMYSLCTLDEPTESGAKIFHLYGMQEMIAIGDPITHYELAPEASETAEP